MKDWKRIKISPQLTIIEAMRVIDKLATQFVVVVDDGNHLVGTITDGDIRRGILKGLSLDSSCDKVMNAKPFTCKSQDEEKILKILKEKKITHIPIVNEDNVIIDIRSREDFLDKRVAIKENAVILMAGGLGSRLGELTENCPKPMLKVGNKPILEIIIENFKQHGFKNFFLAVNYKSEIIEEYFGDGNKHEVNINYIREEKKLGTAGALSLLPQDVTGPVIVMNGDVLTNTNFADLLKFHITHKNMATMCVRQYEIQVPYGVIQTVDENIVHIDEKPVQEFFVNAGVYVLDTQALQTIPKNTPFDMPNVFNLLIEKKKKIGAFPILEYWLDIGRKDDLERAQIDINKH